MKLVTLLYIKDLKGNYLFIERIKEPNKGKLSPPGGKLDTTVAESPFQNAVREAFEECGIKSSLTDWSLRGIVTEKDYPNAGNLLMFLMEFKHNLANLPKESNEGKFHFFSSEELADLNIPLTDKLFIWNQVLNNPGKFFSIKIDCSTEPYNCTLETEQ